MSKTIEVATSAEGLFDAGLERDGGYIRADAGSTPGLEEARCGSGLEAV